MALGPATFGAAFFFSPDVTGPSKADGYYYELNGSLPIPNSKLSVSGAIGRQAFQGPGDYTTWNLGVGYAITDRIGVDVRYWDTNASEATYGKLGAAKAVASVKVGF
jgi:hypothetical protein